MIYEFTANPQCAVCGSGERRYLGRRVPRTLSLPDHLVTEIFECRHCGLVYPDPLPQADTEQSFENYSHPDQYFPRPIGDERFAFCRSVLARLAPYVGGGRRLLDLGSGRGELLHVAQAEQWTAVGIEPSPVFAAQAQRQFGVTVLSSYIDALPVPDERFDAVTLLSVLEQSAAPIQLLTSALQWLRPGGVVYIETTNQDGLVLRTSDLYYRLRGKRQTSRLSPTFPSFQRLGYAPRTVQTLFNAVNCDVLRIECEANRDPSYRLRQRGLADRLLGSALHAVNVASRITGTGAVMTTIARRP